jgi:thymidine phosphorylase
LYALRDATATVPHIPLIVASIMSKKLAEGLDALVLDVKTGSGAFIKEFGESVRLAEALCATGRAFNVNTVALVTDMSEPLGKFVGNAVEVYECLKILRGESDPQMAATLELSIELTARMLTKCGLAGTVEDASTKINTVIGSGEALERFRQNIELQGGDQTICDRPESILAKGLVETAVLAGEAGFVAAIDTFAVGLAVCEIGGGRTNAEQSVDNAVGFACHVKLGDRVETGDTLGVIYSRTADQAESIVPGLLSAYHIDPENRPEHLQLIKQAVG